MITVEGPKHSLDSYYDPYNDANPFVMQVVSGKGTAYGVSSTCTAAGDFNVAVQGRHKSLEFYYENIGANHWSSGQTPPGPVAGRGTTFGSPSLSDVNGYAVIAVEGAKKSLDYYYQPNGPHPWSTTKVAPSGSTYG